MSRTPTRPSKIALTAAVSCAALFAASGAWAQSAAQRSPEVELTLRVCRSGPGTLTARAERSLGDTEVGAIEPNRNPSLVVEHQQILSGPSERETIVGAEIPLQLGGRRGLLRDAARARRHASSARADADVFATALEFREAYAAAALEHARLLVLREQQKSLEALTAALQQLAARGESAAYDVRRHQAEVRLHGRRVAAAEARATMSAQRLSIWLDQPVDAASLMVGSALGVGFGRMDTSVHPELYALRFGARAAGLEEEAARRRWVPELEVFAGYRQLVSGGETGHGLSLGLNVPLTFFEHGQGSSSKARGERMLAEARALRLQRQRDVELRAALTRAAALEAAFRQAEQGLTETTELMEDARRLYAAGESSIADLLDAYRTAEEAALDRLAAFEELWAARLEGMRAAGKQFHPELDASCGSRAGATR